MSGSTGCSDYQSNADEKRKEEEDNVRQRNIVSLNRTLSAVKNLSEPICQFLQFEQTCLTPQTRALFGLNYMMMAMCGAKGAIKTWIDHEYMDIKDPPSTLKDGVTKAYSDIDKVTAEFEKSIKEIATMIQTIDATAVNTPKAPS